MKQAIHVPDLGSDAEFPIIEILAQTGEVLAVDAPILLLESDKASMEIPAPVAGELINLTVKVGDLLRSGQVIGEMQTTSDTATNETTTATATPNSPVQTDSSASTSANTVSTASPSSEFDCEMLVIGSGPGGYSAAFRSADLGMKTILVEKYASLGGVCLNVGCIPSKALLHTAHILEEAQALQSHGVSFAPPTIDLDKIRAHKDEVVGKLTKGIAAMAKMRQVEVVTGTAQFIDPHTVAIVNDNDAITRHIRFAKAIIAVGSRVIKLPFMPDDPRVIDSTGALQLQNIPEHLLVIGGGIIGMEMATVYSALGAKVSVVELSPSLMPGADPDLIKPWLKKNQHRFSDIFLESKVVAAEATDAGIAITFSGKTNAQKVYDKVLVAVGRAPNGALIAAEQAGVQVDERGFIAVDKQMRSNIEHIFAIGDVIGQPMLAHKAVHEGHVAAEAASGKKSYFDARVIPSVAYTNPEIAFVGLSETQAQKEGIAYKAAIFPWSASGKAIANQAQEGFTKLLFDPQTERLLGGGIVGLNAGDLIAEIALAIELGADATDIGKTIHPHPTLSESIGMAAEVFSGHCTDLPPPKSGQHK